MPTYTAREKKEEQKHKQVVAIMPKSLREAGHYYRKHEETWEAFAKRIQLIVDAYNKALSSTPDPDTLHQPDWDNKKITWEQRDLNMDLNQATIQGWEDAAKSTRAWVGRTLTDGVGDGNAVYVVVKENKKSVRVKVCRGIGDDWVSRHFGEESSVDKVTACGFMEWHFGTERVLPHDMKMKK